MIFQGNGPRIKENQLDDQGGKTINLDLAH